MKIPLQQFKLVVSCIGYKRVVKEMTSAQFGSPLLFTLEAEPIVAAELTVHSTNQVWRDNFERFKKTFLGATQASKFCKILNPECLEFTTTDTTLNATASQPLIVENRALGYKITYRLTKFQEQHLGRYDARVITSGESFYQPLTPKDDREVAFWEETRRRVYFGSERHFFRTLALHNTAEEGFEVNQVDCKGYYEGEPMRRTLNPKTMALDTRTSSLKTLYLTDCIELVYLKALFEPEYRDAPFIKRDGRTISGWTMRPNIISLIQSHRPVMFIDTLGNLHDAEEAITIGGYSAWKRFADALPQNFNPNTDFNPNAHLKADLMSRAEIGDTLRSVSLLLQRGQKRLLEQDLQNALADFTKVIDLDRNNFEAFYFRGLTRKQLKEFSRANADFTAAMFIKPDIAAFYFQRGITRLQLAEYQDAITDLTVALDKDSTLTNQYSCLMYRGIAYGKQNADSLALSNFNKALRLAPTADIYLQRGLIYKKQKKYSLAENDFSESLKLQSSGSAYFERGSLRMATGDRISGYLDLVKARSFGNDAAKKFLEKYEGEAGGDTLRFYNTKEIIVEAQTELFKESVKDINTMIDIGKIVIQVGGMNIPQTMGGNLFSITNAFDCNSGVVRTKRPAKIHIFCLALLIKEITAGMSDSNVLRLVHEIYSDAYEIATMQVSADPSISMRAPIAMRQIEDNMNKLQVYLKSIPK